MFQQELQNLGLSEKEAKVYIASLGLGADTVQNIAKKAGINRPTAYVQIESLKEKGLMSQVEKGKKTFYLAESPERLESLLNVFEKELNLKKSEVGRILPALQNIFAGAGERPKVRFYEGMEEIKSIQNDFLKAERKQVEGFVNLDKLQELFPDFAKSYTPKRIARKIESKVLYNRGKGRLEEATNPAELRTAKHINFEKLPISSDITIYDDKVAFLAYKVKPIGVIVESKEIAATLRAMFYLIWDTLE